LLALVIIMDVEADFLTGRAMRAKRFLAGTAAGVMALAVIGGCANQIKQLEPKLELRNAAQNLGAEKQTGFTLKLTGSADDLAAAVKKQDPDTSADDIDSLKKLFNSSFTVAVDQAGDGAEDDRASLAATVDGVAGTELRVVDQTLYLKAPVADLVRKFGGAESDVSEMQDEFTQADPALKAFFTGGWVSLNVKDMAKTQDTDSAKVAAEAKKSAQNLFDGAQIERDKADKTHLIVTTSTTKAYSELKRLVTAVGGDETKSLSDELDKAPKDRPIVLDLWIDDDKLVAAEINLLQFIDGATGRVALRIDVTTGAPIEAPPGAAKIDPALLSSFAGAGTGAAGATQVAQSLGLGAISLASAGGDKPSAHLKEAASMLDGSPYQVRIVRTGVAEVTAGNAKACLTVPATTAKKPKVTAGAC
jgi:hypothetical protein